MKPALPSLPEAEAAAVGCLFHGASPDAVPLREEHFANETCRLAFRGIRALADARAPVTLQSVTSHLRSQGRLDDSGGPGAIAALHAEASGGPAALEYHFGDLERARQNRCAVRFIHESLADLSSFRLDAPAFAEELATRCAPVAAQAGSTAAEIVAEIEATEQNGEPPEAFATGLLPMDDLLGGGFRRGWLSVVAGDTGAGKSAFLIQCAAAACQANQPVLYLSLEMPRADVLRRLAAAASNKPIPNRDSSANVRKEFRDALCAAQTYPLTIHDNLHNLADIAAAIRTAARRNKATLVVLDYLQLAEATGDTRELALSETARRLKALALGESIAILTASQLNDDGRLRESRAIGHHADAVLTLNKGESGHVESATLLKFRHGPAPKTVPCRLDGARSRIVTAP